MQVMRNVFLPVMSFLMMALILTGCGNGILYPGISYPPTYTYTPGRFVWRDLITTNPEASKKFYESVFGWTFEAIGTEEATYYLIRNNNEAIGGMLKYTGDAGNGEGARWICSLSTQDLHGAIRSCTGHGGTVIRKPFSVKGRGTVAVVKDNQGAIVALIHARDGDPFAKEAAMYSWLWTELWSNDPAGSSGFYSGFTGYTSEKTEVNGKDYWLFRDHDKIVSSMVKNPLENTSALWVPYIRVGDPAAVTGKAKTAGAALLLEPSPLIRKGSVAVMMDPGGAIFCIQKWPVE
jgi:predicted enzyme related to lactoylglutathione lyase